MKKTRLIVAGAVVAAVAAVLVVLSTRDPQETDPTEETEEAQAPSRRAQLPGKASPRGAVAGKSSVKRSSDGPDDPGTEEMDGEEEGEPAPAMTEEEKQAEEEEKRVDEFDSAVDKWMEPQGTAVTMAEVDRFRDTFRRVPKARKEECVQRALNLIPDENVMLLAGILFDKEQDAEILELVYNDILNRDEDVKKPILQELFKDKEHPNWADTAWILDVTGELPKGGEASSKDGEEPPSDGQ